MFISSLEASVGVVLIMALGYFFKPERHVSGAGENDDEQARHQCHTSRDNFVQLPELFFEGRAHRATPVFLVTVATMVLSLFLTWLIALIIRVPNRRRGQFMQGAVTSNSSFIGFPMVESVFGAAGNPPMVLLYFGQTLFTNTVGVMLTRRDAGVINGGGGEAADRQNPEGNGDSADDYHYTVGGIGAFGNCSAQISYDRRRFGGQGDIADGAAVCGFGHL